MSKISLFLADVDGSLVTTDKVLTKRALKAVEQLREAGIEMAITSGRPPRGMRMFIDELKITTLVAGFNGGVIVDPKNYSVIQSFSIPEDIVPRVYEMLSQYHLAVWVYTQQDWFVPSLNVPHLAHEEKNVRFSPTVMPNLKEAAHKLIKIVGISDDYEAITTCEKAMQKELKGKVTAEHSQPYYLDITALEANKGSALETLSRELGIPKQEIATMGDMPNDVPMFKDCGLSIAMGNASKEVQQQADYVTTSNDDEGFANAVEQFIL